MTRRWVDVLAVAVAVVAFAGCGDDQVERFDAEIVGARATADERTIWVELGGCAWDPEVAVDETVHEVVLTSRTAHHDTFSCYLAQPRVDLAAPLGDRRLVDGVTGEPVRVVRCHRSMSGGYSSFCRGESPSPP